MEIVLTQDKFSSNSDIVYIQFDDIVKCYDRQVLIDWFTNQEPFCIWLGSTDPYRRKDFRLYKLYQREYITPYSVDLIARSTARAFEAVYFDTVLIGNAVGDLGVSTVHGTESARVYYLKYI
jgi:hypothetical protein